MLSRVQAFLPALEASNLDLEQRRPEEIDIEHLEPDAGQYIEMVRSMLLPKPCSSPLESYWRSPILWHGSKNRISDSAFSSSEDQAPLPSRRRRHHHHHPQTLALMMMTVGTAIASPRPCRPMNPTVAPPPARLGRCPSEPGRESRL